MTDIKDLASLPSFDVDAFLVALEEDAAAVATEQFGIGPIAKLAEIVEGLSQALRMTRAELKKGWEPLSNQRETAGETK